MTTTQAMPTAEQNVVQHDSDAEHRGRVTRTDPVLYWNAAALEADRAAQAAGDPKEVSVLGPCGSSRALAIVHLAIHDAFFGVRGTYDTYLGSLLPEPPAGAGSDAAIAGAAHATLSALYPTQKAYFDAQHAAAGLTSGKGNTSGHAFGQAVAEQILALRADDPGLGDDGYASSVAAGHHRPDPDHPRQGFYAPFYGARSQCFAVTCRHHLDAPPQPGGREYEQALRQVRSKGIAPHLIGALPLDLLPSRTPDETGIGFFWAYDKGTLGSPLRHYNRIIRQVAAAQGNDVERNARLFALVNAAMADAGILAWYDKYFHDLWRPVLGIREHDPSLGPTGSGRPSLSADADPGWLPLGAQATNLVGQKNFTPPFPSYPSGHATLGAAAFQTVRHFYGQDRPGPDTLADGLVFVSEELDGISVDNTGTVRPRLARSFPNGLWQMIEENSISRVFLGVHWSFDGFAVDEDGQMDLSRNVGGVRLGLDIANDIAAHGLSADLAAPSA